MGCLLSHLCVVYSLFERCLKDLTDGLVQCFVAAFQHLGNHDHASMDDGHEQAGFSPTNATSSTESAPRHPITQQPHRSEGMSILPSPEIEELERRYNEQNSQLQAIGQELEISKKATRKLTNENAILQTKLDESQRAAQASQAEVALLRKHLQQEYALRADDRKLLETRTRELQDAQAYLTMVDTAPVAEILSMVEDINSDIFQTAATIAEGSFSRDYEFPKLIMEDAEYWFGIDLTQLLYNARHRDSESRSLIIQTVIQAALTQACSNVTLLWDATLEGTSLDYAYNNIRATSSQSVSARWRVLTRANTKYVNPVVVENAALARFVYFLSLVLGISGWTGAAASDWDVYRQTVETQFKPDLEQIVKDVVTLDRAMGEGLMSMDAELVTIEGGALFDASFMENGFGGDDRNGDSSEGDRSTAIVGCTCDLGLQTMTGEREGGGVRTRLLLKPKVVLWSALLDASETDTQQL